ncbi:MAG: hypothetical protein KDB22_19100 [Planctomycetales bacterium]|nr:hypothetical protein [Planctomycetales bacterium]
MRFGIFTPDDLPLHSQWLHAFAEGLQLRGVNYQINSLEEGYRPCDVVVTFGIPKLRTPRGRAIQHVLRKHKDCSAAAKNIVIELGFVHRDRYFMVGWGGLNGRADFRNDGCSSDRWNQLGVEPAPWRVTGDHIVLCGQVPWDASVQHRNHAQWCRETAIELRKYSDRPIVFRPHPLQPDAIDMAGTPVQVSNKASLREDLDNAWAVVTFNSNAGVEATLAGIPAFVADRGAMGYKILNRNLALIESPNLPDRTQWLYDLAYTQWTLDELARGETIDHLFLQGAPLTVRLRCGIRQFASRTQAAVRKSKRRALSSLGGKRAA